MTTALDEKRFPLLDLTSLRGPEIPTPVSNEILASLSEPPRSVLKPVTPALKDRVQRVQRTSPRRESDYNFEVESASTRASLLMVIILVAAFFHQYIGLMHDRQERAIADVREQMRIPHANCRSMDRSPELRAIDCRLEQQFMDELEGLQRRDS